MNRFDAASWYRLLDVDAKEREVSAGCVFSTAAVKKRCQLWRGVVARVGTLEVIAISLNDLQMVTASPPWICTAHQSFLSTKITRQAAALQEVNARSHEAESILFHHHYHATARRSEDQRRYRSSNHSLRLV